LLVSFFVLTSTTIPTLTVVSSGAYAANLLGLSDQVPMKIVFLTDGSPRRIQLGKLPLASTMPAIALSIGAWRDAYRATKVAAGGF
jgi:hypothetical protein